MYCERFISCDDEERYWINFTGRTQLPLPRLPPTARGGGGGGLDAVKVFTFVSVISNSIGESMIGGVFLIRT